MSELSETELAGCTDILNSMTKSSILSLCDTITNKLVVVEDFAGMLLILNGYWMLARIQLAFLRSRFIIIIILSLLITHLKTITTNESVFARLHQSRRDGIKMK